jgi:hypothetical protein
MSPVNSHNPTENLVGRLPGGFLIGPGGEKLVGRLPGGFLIGPGGEKSAGKIRCITCFY